MQSPLATLIRTTFEAAPWAVPILRGQTKRSGGISATLSGSPSAPLASTLSPMIGNHSSDGELRIEVIEGTPRRALGGGGRLGRSSLSDPDNDKYGKNRGQPSSSSSWLPSYVSLASQKWARLMDLLFVGSFRGDSL